MFGALGHCAAVHGQRGRGGLDLCPWSYRGGGGRGQRSPLCAGKVCVRQPRQGSRRGSGQRDGPGVPSPGASHVLSPSVPAAVGGSGQEEEEAMVNAGAAACATGKDRPQALPLLFNLCCCQHVTPSPSISHTKITNVISITVHVRGKYERGKWIVKPQVVSKDRRQGGCILTSRWSARRAGDTTDHAFPRGRDPPLHNDIPLGTCWSATRAERAARRSAAAVLGRRTLQGTKRGPLAVGRIQET